MTGDIKHTPTLESVVCICKSVQEWKIAEERGNRARQDKREKEVWIKRREPHREDAGDYSLVSSFGIISTTELN